VDHEDTKNEGKGEKESLPNRYEVDSAKSCGALDLARQNTTDGPESKSFQRGGVREASRDYRCAEPHPNFVGQVCFKGSS